MSSFEYFCLWSRCGVNVCPGCATDCDVVSGGLKVYDYDLEYANGLGEDCGCLQVGNVGGRGRRSANVSASKTALWICSSLFWGMCEKEVRWE